MPSFELQDLIPVTSAALRVTTDMHDPETTLIGGYSTDTRTLERGDLFLALAGPNSDGHDYVEAALAKGANAALVSRRWADRNMAFPPRPFLIVPDTQIALGQIASWHAQQLPARRVGVTGSSGKTTTKEMIAAALGASGFTLKNEGSQNGETGVPLTLLNLEAAHDFAVLEMGMRGPGQIRYLAEIVRPEVGVVTNIGRAHLEFLGSVENIARAKGELLELLPPNGFALLPSGDAYLPLLREFPSCAVLTYGVEEDADIRIVSQASGSHSAMFRIVFPDGSETKASIALPGQHNILNATAALSVAWILETNVEAAVDALAKFQPPNMRSAVVPLASGATLLNDAYNANPDSMRAALGVLAGYPPRRVAILGDMLELGDTETEEHLALGQEIPGFADVLVAVGPRSKVTADAALKAGFAKGDVHWFPDSQAAATAINALVQEGDTLLLKGSRGMRMETIADALMGQEATAS
jgi:UDP-N-acetylmuramoyl-tripeptide--D-alanyl-D-alanine ligase